MIYELAEKAKKAVDNNKISINEASKILDVPVREIEKYQDFWSKNPLYELK